jgi:transposase-like protein
MANGQMGKRISEETKTSALKLIAKGNSVPQVAVRLGVSQSVIRNWIRESGVRPRCGTGERES